MSQGHDREIRPVGEYLSPAYHRAGGATLESCLRTAEGLIDELAALASGKEYEEARYREVRAEAQGLLELSREVESTELGVVDLLSRRLPGARVWSGVGLDRLPGCKVRVRGPGSRGGFVLAWSRAQLGEAPREPPLPAGILSPGVCVQAVILDQEIETSEPLVGQVLRAELFWEGVGS